MKFIFSILKGCVMGVANIIPGVSGGTVAFLLGFYDKFINSLNGIISKDKKERKDAMNFLIKLGIGWITGFILAVLFITSVFEKHIYAISSLFTGFIIFSIPLIYKEEKNTISKQYKDIIFLIIGIVIVALITYFNPSSSGDGGMNLAFSNLNIVKVLNLKEL